MTLLRMLAFRPDHAETPAASSGGMTAEKKRATQTPPPVEKSAAKHTARPAEAHQQGAEEADWSELVTRLGLSGAERLLASNCAFLRRSGNTIYLGLDARSDSLLTRQRQDALAAKLSDHYGERLAVQISVDEAVAETPMQEESRIANERMEVARQRLEADPNVRAMKSMFGAEIKPETIELINPSRSD
jgi:DNA polymerase-3 subunit gamma/tau